MSAQDFVVFAIVLAAVLYLGRALMHSVSGTKSCGSCGSGKKCGNNASGGGAHFKPPAGEQLIQIGLSGGFTPGRNGHTANSGIHSTDKHRRENSTTVQ